VKLSIAGKGGSGKTSVSETMAALAHDLGLERVALVANKIRDERELAVVQAFADRHDLELGGTVPFDECFLDAERASEAPLDFAGDAPAIRAIDEIARRWGRNGHAPA